MPDHSVAESLCNPYQQPVDLVRSKLDDLPRLQLNQIIMATIRNAFYARSPHSEVPPVENALVAKQANGSVDSRECNPWIDLPHASMKLLNIGLIATLGKNHGDDTSLVGDAYALVNTETLDSAEISRYGLAMLHVRGIRPCSRKVQSLDR